MRMKGGRFLSPVEKGNGHEVYIHTHSQPSCGSGTFSNGTVPARGFHTFGTRKKDDNKLLLIETSDPMLFN